MIASPLPAAFVPRDYQLDAVDAIIDAYDDGAEVVFLDAPTGSGKTIIAELVRRRLAVDRSLYVCSDKQLQRQFMRDFDAYARLLQGRGNYRTQLGPRGITADDCTGTGGEEEACMWCEYAHTCPYRVAKTAALGAEVAVLNTAYLLHEANFVGEFSKQEFIVVDEGDALENSLLGMVEYTVPEWIGKRVGLTYPLKGARKPRLIEWCNEAVTLAQAFRSRTVLEPKELKRLLAWIIETKRVVGELSRELAHGGSDDAETGTWLRSYDTRTFTMQPVYVGRFGPRYLWRHASRWLVMSATIISPHELADSLGLPYEWACVQVPSTFPVERRPIVLAPVANVTRAQMDEAIPRLGYAIERVLDMHPGERVLVHTVSYDLTRRLAAAVSTTRPVFTYDRAAGKQEAIARYLRTPGAVMFAPSMERGVDLRGDACGVQIVAKCPFPSLGDRRVAARMHLPGGDQWYKVQTIRDIVQMTGRGMRDANDHCVTYILDGQFTKNVWRSKGLFPRWWQDAVDTKFDVRGLIMPRASARAIA